MRIDHEQHARSSPEPRFSSRAHGSAPACIAGVKRALVMSRARLVLEEVFGPVNDRRFAVRLWDGSTDMPTVAGTPSFTLVVNSPGALRRMFLPPSELRLAESFVCGDVDIEGDLESATALGDAVRDRLGSPESLTSVALGLLALPSDAGMTHLMQQRELGAERRAPQHSRASDSAAIRSHYDVGNDFYALWLDRAMVYSCAYFETEDDDIDDAQRAKLDLICRKLRLAPDERLLDIGCGWGGSRSPRGYALWRVGARSDTEPCAGDVRQQMHLRRGARGEVCGGSHRLQGSSDARIVAAVRRDRKRRNVRACGQHEFANLFPYGVQSPATRGAVPESWHHCRAGAKAEPSALTPLEVFRATALAGCRVPRALCISWRRARHARRSNPGGGRGRIRNS